MRPHGTYTRYTLNRCRCERCRAANARVHRERGAYQRYRARYAGKCRAPGCERQRWQSSPRSGLCYRHHPRSPRRDLPLPDSVVRAAEVPREARRGRPAALTPDQVRALRELRAGGATFRGCARAFGVSVDTATRVVRGEGAYAGVHALG